MNVEHKSSNLWKLLLVILAIAGAVAAVAVVCVRMQKEIGALRYRLEQWMRLRPAPLKVDLTED